MLTVSEQSSVDSSDGAPPTILPAAADNDSRVLNRFSRLRNGRAQESHRTIVKPRESLIVDFADVVR